MIPTTGVAPRDIRAYSATRVAPRGLKTSFSHLLGKMIVFQDALIIARPYSLLLYNAVASENFVLFILSPVQQSFFSLQGPDVCYIL